MILILGLSFCAFSAKAASYAHHCDDRGLMQVPEAIVCILACPIFTDKEKRCCLMRGSTFLFDRH